MMIISHKREMEESRVPVRVVMRRRTVTEPNYDDGDVDCHSYC